MSRSRRRRGSLLIECLVLITVLSLLIGLCAGMIHLLLKLDQAGRDASDEAADLARLGRDFRDDAHSASPDGPPIAKLEKIVFPIEGSRSVEYSVRPDVVLRTVFDGEKATRHETYRRPARASVRIERTTEGPRPFVSMTIDRLPGERDVSSYREYRIEAELGKHRRLNPRKE